MDSKILAKILRALRLTEEGIDGQTLAAMNRINNILQTNAISWTDLLGGDPDDQAFPRQPLWFSGSKLEPEEMQALFDAGFAKGKQEALEETAKSERKKTIDDYLDQQVTAMAQQYNPQNAAMSAGQYNPFLSVAVPRTRKAASPPSAMTSNEIEDIIKAADLFIFTHGNNSGFSAWQLTFIKSYLERKLPLTASYLQEKALREIDRHVKTSATAPRRRQST